MEPILGKSTIIFLPIIDLSPTDPTCIYTTLKFVIDQAKSLNIKTPVLTFDQPLWLKATEIKNCKSMDIVLILGGFHLMMSFMGSIGSLMKGSGLSEALSTCYGINAIEHMMSGKAVSRALRGHFLATSALQTKLLTPLFPSSDFEEDKGDGEIDNFDIDFDVYNEFERENDIEIDDQENTIEDEDAEQNEDKDNLPFDTLSLEDLTNLEKLGENLINHPQDAEKFLAESETIQKLIESHESYVNLLQSKSRTAKFWLQYQRYVNVLKCFIKAERTGNWSLHLDALSNMINLFAATGHINYAKCARLHLQNMLELENNHPWVYEKFAVHGFHTIRRTDHFWAGIWSDLAIEQVLMRSLKSRGGLTRGRGVTESVRLIWLKTMHCCAEIHNSMISLAKLLHVTSEQHVELGASRKRRDNNDLQKITNWFSAHNPFLVNEPSLKSLSTGLIATEEIDCDEAEKVGENIQKTLDNITIEEAKVSRKSAIKTLDTLQTGISIDEKTVYIDPLILFTRLAAIIQRDGCVIDYFNYELTPEPTSLFKGGLMRKAAKSSLRNHILKKADGNVSSSSASCVVDGGALLHKIKWTQGSTFQDIIKSYLDYIRVRFREYQNLCIVFDGYDDEMSIKATEHSRRSAQLSSSNVDVTEKMILTSNREVFLRNQINKKNFIKLLCQVLTQSGIDTLQSKGDADVLIVKKSLEEAVRNDVDVVAEDTDILILLLHHWKINMNEIFFNTELKVNQGKVSFFCL